MMSREPLDRASRVGTLDGIRGLAILLVVAGHVVQNFQPLDPDVRRWLAAFANAGAGVRLFFVLSGYLITHLLLKEFAATGTISIRQFWWRRALRILPAFYVYLLSLVVLGFWIPTGLDLPIFTAAATFTWNYALLWITPAPEGFWNLGHLWTLALEQQFYLFWPVALLACGLRRGRWLAVALIVWCPLARVATYCLFPSQRGHLGAMFHTGVDGLMIGCFAALALQSAALGDYLRQRGPAIAAVAVCWLAILSPIVAELVHGFPAAAGYSLDAVASAWIVVWVHRSPSSWVERGLGHGILPALGVISYSLYLWQQWFLHPAGPLAHGNILAPVGLSVLAAFLSYRLVERPALLLKTRSAGIAVPGAS